MTTLHASPPAVRDDDTQRFVSTFMTYVATLAGYRANRIATIADVEALLLSAITSRDGASSPSWTALYRAVDHVLVRSSYARDTRVAYVYLTKFLDENRDLA